MPLICWFVGFAAHGMVCLIRPLNIDISIVGSAVRIADGPRGAVSNTSFKITFGVSPRNPAQIGSAVTMY